MAQLTKKNTPLAAHQTAQLTAGCLAAVEAPHVATLETPGRPNKAVVADPEELAKGRPAQRVAIKPPLVPRSPPLVAVVAAAAAAAAAATPLPGLA
jgi:hypothetical protein